MQNKKIIILATACDSTNYVFNEIEKKYAIEKVIIEQKESKLLFIKRRIKKLGVLKVIGQLQFMLLISKVISLFSRKRMKEIQLQFNLNNTAIPENKIIQFNSINDTSCITYLQNENPDLVIVNGTRIISKKVLQAVHCKFINMHAGITPMYRGVHGMYWALANNDKENAGITIHFVDAGIDTGNIIKQAFCKAQKNDNFVTYPYLQFGAGIQLFTKVIDDYFSNQIIVKSSNLKSQLFYHPTAIEYLSKRFLKGVK